MSDQLFDGRRIRVLTIVDAFSKVSPAIDVRMRYRGSDVVDTSISGQRLAAFLDVLGNQHGLPQEIVLDNGPELTSKAMFLWSQRTGVKLNFIQPGKPVQNAFCESFNGTFRDNCLNQHWFMSLKEARSVINEWRKHYNEERPHSSLGYQPPATFAKLQARRFQSPAAPSANLPVAEKAVA